ncbi:hypothetical protein ACHAWO_001063 [Cyclotella atomus]|uniref:SAP domain-containing protein n=1 Tax=Cyclotella atomus TaxID=382360 RepID=A0ABD3PNH2_9STRA
MSLENLLVQERVMTKENVSDYILFADAQSCPSLKECAIAFFLRHCKTVLKSESSTRLLASRDYVETDSITVTELRKELEKRKLDMDGSKEALVEILEKAKRQERD